MLVEANETFLKKDEALVGRSLVKASKNVFVRLMNPSVDTQIIYPGTIVAQVSPVQEVVNPNSKIDEGELRTDLINLLERSQEHLTPKQSSEVKGSIVKHKIATGSAHPIKQPPRRLPDVLAKEVDKQVKGMLNNEVITPSSKPLVIACRLGEKEGWNDPLLCRLQTFECGNHQ